MKKLTVLTLLSLPIAMVMFCHQLTLATAATATASASPQPSETTQKLKDRIEKIVEEKKDQIMGVLDDLSQKKRGFIGEVQRVSAESITIKTNKETQIISLNNGATITKQGKALPVDDIAVGDWVIVISKLVDDELQPERVFVSSTSLRPTPQAVTIGNVFDINKTKITLNTKLNQEKREFLITKNTKYQDVNGDPIKASQITTDLQALVVATEASKGQELKVIRILAPLEKP